MRATKPCSRRVLATGDYSLIEQCSCGHVHLTIGAITMRLDPTVIADLAETINAAAHQLSHRHVHRHGDELVS